MPSCLPKTPFSFGGLCYPTTFRLMRFCSLYQAFREYLDFFAKYLDFFAFLLQLEKKGLLTHNRGKRNCFQTSDKNLVIILILHCHGGKPRGDNPKLLDGLILFQDSGSGRKSAHLKGGANPCWIQGENDFLNFS